MHEWMTDNGLTPLVVIDAQRDDVQVPTEHVSEGRIIINVSWQATRELQLGNDSISFSARFGGRPFPVDVPVASVLGIYARETGQGMVFGEPGQEPDPDGPGGGERPGGGSGSDGDDARGSGRASHLKVVK